MIDMLALELLFSRAGIFHMMSRIPELWNGLHSSWHGVRAVVYFGQRDRYIPSSCCGRY